MNSPSADEFHEGYLAFQQHGSARRSTLSTDGAPFEDVNSVQLGTQQKTIAPMTTIRSTNIPVSTCFSLIAASQGT
jgi:hypothetical protein